MGRRRLPGRRSRAARRLLLAGVVIAITLAYIGPVRGYLEQRSELQGYQAALRSAEAQRDRIARQIEALRQPAVLEARARELDMVRPGEQSFLVDGLRGQPTPRVAAEREERSIWDRHLGLV
jgi:cell division protein FtsB